MYSICLTSTIEYEKQDSETFEKYIVKIAAGDKAALSSLYEKTKVSAYGYALSILRNTYDAEDVLQETYIRIFSASEGYQALGKPMAWILTIVRNLSLMLLREKGKTQSISEDDFEKFFIQNEKMSFEDKELLKTAMKTLSDTEFEFVMLHAVSGFKHREIAKFYDLPLSTVLSKYRRAIKKLQTIL